MLGFKVDPVDRLVQVHKELSSLLKVHKAKPLLGVDAFLQKQVSKTSLAADLLKCGVSYFTNHF